MIDDKYTNRGVIILLVFNKQNRFIISKTYSRFVTKKESRVEQRTKGQETDSRTETVSSMNLIQLRLVSPFISVCILIIKLPSNTMEFQTL